MTTLIHGSFFLDRLIGNTLPHVHPLLSHKLLLGVLYLHIDYKIDYKLPMSIVVKLPIMLDYSQI